GSSYPSIYVWGTPAGDSFQGIYRSDDGGNTWLQIDDVSHQWGYPLAADPYVFGRLYAAAGSSVAGNPSTSLPANWSDVDINEPGNPGWATSSTTLSTGTTVNQWNVVGGGAGFSSTPISISSLSRTGGVATAITTTASGLQVGQTITIAGATNSAYDGTFVVTGLYNTVAGLNADIGAATEFTFAIASGTDTASGTITATLDDQFNFASQPITGSAAVSAQISSITNADAGIGTPQAGVMYRASTNPADPFVAVVQTSASSLALEYRTTSGAGITTQNVTGVPVGSEYVEIVRSGNNFSGFYSSNGSTWTQLGSTVAVPAMGTTANVGLVATASYNSQLTSATFTHVSVVPFVYSDTSGNNTYAIDLNASNPLLLQIFVNTPEAGTPTYTIAAAQVPSLTFEPGSGNDSLTVDFSNGDPVPSSGGVSLVGGSGSDALFIEDPTGNNTASINGTQVSFDGSVISYSSTKSINISTGSGNDTLTQNAQPGASVTFSGGSGTDTLTVNGGTYTFAGDPEASTSGLTVNDNSAVVFSAGNGGGINKLHLAGLNI